MHVHRPTSVRDAVRALARGGAAVAGGTVIARWLGESEEGRRTTTVVDLSRLQELRGVRDATGQVCIGAMTAIASLADRPGAFGDAARSIANPTVRNAATLGGNLAGVFPGADFHVAALVLDAEARLEDAGGPTAVPVERIVEDGIPRGALLTEVRYSADRERRSRFEKFAWRSVSGRTIVAVGAAVELDGGRVRVARLAVSGLTSVARRAREVERALEGVFLDDAAAEDAARAAADAFPIEITGPSEAYRRRLVAAGLRRALLELTRS